MSLYLLNIININFKKCSLILLNIEKLCLFYNQKTVRQKKGFRLINQRIYLILKDFPIPNFKVSKERELTSLKHLPNKKK
jgi:hypothetical protein